MVKAFGPGLFLLTLLITFALLHAAKLPLSKRSLLEGEGREGDQVRPLPSKRTFCNAFTGCGRKRSEGGSGAVQREEDYPGEDQGEGGEEIEELARDILAQARLWEALQARNSIRFNNFNPTQSKGGYGFRGRQKRSSSAMREE